MSLAAPDPRDRLPAERFVRTTGEAVLIALVVLAPWFFACSEPPFEFALSVGILLLVSLWAIHAALSGQFTFRFDVVSIGLIGIAVWTVTQLVPLPESVVGVVSPGRLDWHHSLLPDQSEVLPGEPGSVPRRTWLTLTPDSYATRTFLARVVGVLLVYAAARNWLASRESFPRLAWALVGNGVLLAGFALGHAASAPRNVVYWDMPVEGEGAFGPFICRNHYVDYIALCAGLGIGLLLPRRGQQDKGTSLTALMLGLSAAIGLMLVSVPFSLSRGAVMAIVLAGGAVWLLSRRGAGRASRIGLVIVLGVGLLVAAWFGTGLIEDRLATIGTGEAIEGRSTLWRDTLKLLPTFWATGTGGGTFEWIEPTVRSGSNALVYYNNAHNEYLEAFVEGGVLRLAFTLLIVIGMLTVLVRGYRQRVDRTVGPWILGALFGLAVGAIHAVADFGIHMPAIAIATAAVAGYAMAAATDERFVPQRREKSANREATADRGRFAPFLALVLAALGLFVVLDARDRYLSDRLRLAALFTLWNPHDPDRLVKRAAILEARAARFPDSVALYDAGQARIDVAIEQSWLTGATLGGVGAGYAGAPDHILPSIADRTVGLALRDVRAARDANPLAPKPHTRLALYAHHFQSSEPTAVHFARAKQLLPTDPDVWFASGKAALRRGDDRAAWADWKQSLTLSSQNLVAILKLVRGKLSPSEIRATLLSDEPVTLMNAADVLFPDRDPEGRRPFVDAAAAQLKRPDLSVDQILATAFAADELGRTDEAVVALRGAVTMAPNRVEVRDRVARWLEADERYEEAIPHLEWLFRKSPANTSIRDRLDAARHGLNLRKAIGE